MKHLCFSPFLSCRMGVDARGIKQMRSVLFYGLPLDTFVLFNAANLVDEVRELPVGGEMFVSLTIGRYFIKETSLAMLEKRLNRYEESTAGNIRPDWSNMYYFKRTPKCFILKGISGVEVKNNNK